MDKNDQQLAARRAVLFAALAVEMCSASNEVAIGAEKPVLEFRGSVLVTRTAEKSVRIAAIAGAESELMEWALAKAKTILYDCGIVAETHCFNY